MRPLATGLLTLTLTLLSLAGLQAQQPGAGENLGLDAPKVLDAPAGEPLGGEELELRTHQVASLMRCPVCQGLSIADSPVDSAVAMKQEVRDLLALGYSEEQILTYFEGAYGEFIRLAPKPRGFNLVVWIAPVLAILAGLALVVKRLRRPKKSGAVSADDPEADAELDGYLDRVRQEAKR